MGIFKNDGTRVTKASFPKTAVADPEFTVDVDLNVTRQFSPTNDKNPDGSLRSVLVKAGAVLRQSEIDALFPAATIAAVSPANGTTAGGTAITITGTNLDGTSGVTVGGAAATNVVVVSPTKLTCTTPAGTAGAKSVVVTTAAGSVTATGAYTYA